MGTTTARHFKTLVLCCITLLLPVSALALNFHFDDWEPNTVIEGMNLGGLTITSSDARFPTRVVSGSGPQRIGYRSPSNAVTNDDLIRRFSLILTFDSLVSSVTLTGGDRGGDTDQFTVAAFDASDGELGSFTTPVFGGTAPADSVIMADFYTVTLSFSNIKKVTVSNAVHGGIGIDDVMAVPVPEPDTLLLLGSGLIGLLLCTRKRSTR